MGDADDQQQDQDPPATGDPNPGDALGDAGKKALEAERKARREAEQRLRDVEGKLKDLTDKDKSEVERLTEQLATTTRERDEAVSRADRIEVAVLKSLDDDAAKRITSAAKRLSGATREELEADADDFLSAFPTTKGATPPPGRKPSPHLKGGTDPTEAPEDLDPAKLAEAIPRP